MDDTPSTPGTELSKRVVLLDKGDGANGKPHGAKANAPWQISVKKEGVGKGRLTLEALPL